MFHFKIFFQYTDLSTVNKQTHEANQLKDSNLILQKKIREKDARIQELIIEKNQVNDENNQLKAENNHIRNRVEDMMNTMQFFFSNLQRK